MSRLPKQGIEIAAVFLGATVVGATVGPQLARIARKTIESRSGEILDALVDRFVEVIKSGPQAAGVSPIPLRTPSTPSHERNVV